MRAAAPEEITRETWLALAGVTAAAFLIGVGVGATIAGYQSAAMAQVGVDQFASANATLRTFQQIGYAIGISVVSTLAAGFNYDGIYSGFVWVIACFVVSGIVMTIGYPSGSAAVRQASASRP